MNERFIRCSECGMPHEEGLGICPSTGKVIPRSSLAQPRTAPPFRPPAPIAPPPPDPSRVAAQPPAKAFEVGKSAPDDAAHFDLMGTLIGGKYRLRAVLGEGGMGTVFEAIHEGLGNLVAIKVLHPNQLQKKDSVQRFHHEARAAARIGHPNICEVYDVGSLDDGRPYLVMDRLTGETLAEHIHSIGGLPFQEVLDALTQVLSGLHAAHEKGIIHRDVKPENVFLTERVGCPPLAKILDFGVSKVMSQDPKASGFSDVEVTRTGVVLGTPYYLAPEQARGERNLDARVDLYACGIMLYECLTGRRPFRAANYNALLIAILTSAPRPVRELRPDLPLGFDRVVEKSIHRDPEDRYQTALEFQAALAPYTQNGLARRATPAAPPAWPRPSTPRQPSIPPPSLPTPAERKSAPGFPQRPSAGPPPTPTTEPRAKAADSPQGARVAPSAPAPGAAPRIVPRPSSPPVPSPLPARDQAERPRKPAQGFDDQETEVDLPRTFAGRVRRPDADETGLSPDSATTKPAPPPKATRKPTALDAFAPRRSAPVLGPPIRPPSSAPFADESATEIMTAAVRSRLAEPTRREEHEKAAGGGPAPAANENDPPTVGVPPRR